MPHLLENIKVWIQYNAALWRESNNKFTHGEKVLFKIRCGIPPVDSLRCMWRRCDHHHISNHVVVPAFGSVHSQDPKHKENHGSGVDQRTHRRLAAHTAAARIEAKRFGWFRFGSR